MSLTTERHDTAWLDSHARDWVAAGLVSNDQADAILRHERAGEAPDSPRLTVVAEVAAYLGSVLTLAGGAAIIGPSWDRLGLIGQFLVAVAIATVALVGGGLLVRRGGDGAERLGTFLWVIGTGGVGLAVAGVVNEIDPRDGAWYSVSIGFPVLVIGAALWRNLERPLQLSTAAVGVGLVGGGFIALTDLWLWIAFPALWLMSLGFGALSAANHIRPRLAALIIAAVGLMIGSFGLMEESERFGAVAAVASATIIVAFALADRSWPLVAVGVLAFFIAITTFLQTVVHGTVARLIAVVLGLIVVTAVALRAQQADTPTSD